MARLLVDQYRDFARGLAYTGLEMESAALKARGVCKEMNADGVRGLVAI